MEVFRLVRKKYGINLSAAGAAIRGGRWNSRGMEMIYTSGSRALAMAEVAVYLSLDNLPGDYMMLSIEIPADVEISTVNLESLPPNWNNFPHSTETQNLGDHFLKERKNCILKVPSAVVPGDHNYLINPTHTGFEKIQISDHQDFPFDRRIFH